MTNRTFFDHQEEALFGQLFRAATVHVCEIVTGIVNDHFCHLVPRQRLVNQSVSMALAAQKEFRKGIV